MCKDGGAAGKWRRTPLDFAGAAGSQPFRCPWIPFERIVSLMRMIDDASLATWFYCHECLLTLMSVAWGLTLDDISLEEWGQQVRFTDYYEKVVGHKFVLIPALTNTPAPQTQDPLPPVT